MRKLIVLLLAAAVIMPLSAAGTGSLSCSMGGVGVAAVGNTFSFTDNPAALYFRDSSNRFLIDGGFGDTVLNSEEYTFPSDPVTRLEARVSGKAISLDISLDYTVEKTGKSGDTWICNAYRTTGVGLQLAAGYRCFAAGFGVSGGSEGQRLGIRINRDNQVFGYAGECFLGSYDRVSNSEFIQMNIGLMYYSGSFSAGFLFDNILDKEGNKTSFSVDSFFSDTGLGIFYSRPEYNGMGHLNILGFSCGADITKLLSEDERTLHIGGELTYRLTSSYSLSVNGGYEAVMNELSNGIFSAGLNGDLGNMGLSADFEIPSDGSFLRGSISCTLMI